MKKLLLIATFFFALAQSANATILLTTPYAVTGPTGIAIGTANYATMTAEYYDVQGNNKCLYYSFGTTTASGGIDQSFTVLAGAPTVSLCMNLTTEAWNAQTSTGVALGTGVITGVGLTNAQAYLTGSIIPLRDAADYFASTMFLPGTQPNKWGAGDL